MATRCLAAATLAVAAGDRQEGGEPREGRRGIDGGGKALLGSGAVDELANVGGCHHPIFWRWAGLLCPYKLGRQAGNRAGFALRLQGVPAAGLAQRLVHIVCRPAPSAPQVALPSLFDDLLACPSVAVKLSDRPGLAVRHGPRPALLRGRRQPQGQPPPPPR